jgi:hypothetical protein
MNTLSEAAAIIKAAETSLRDLMQKALAAGDYRDLPTLARMGEQLSGMTTRIGAPDNPQAEPSSPLRGASVSSSVRQPAPRKPKSSSKKEYPRFKRDGDRLVKIGWSKSDKAEYQHRTPSSVGRTLLFAISNLAKSKELFSVEDILPLTESSDKTEIPPHQIYLALAWLKAEGIVLPKGREGYSLLVTEDPAKLFDERWKALPTR